MEIFIAEESGFCFGVERALKIAHDTVKKEKLPIYTIGPLIHNPQVVKELRKEGIIPVDDLDSIEEGTLIVRSHGLPPSVIEKAKSKGFKIIDATCPFVKQAQEKAELLSKEGYQVLVLGDREHPEVKGILGVVGGSAVCINNHTNIKTISISDRVGIVAQTTQSTEKFSKAVSELTKIAKEVRAFNTICTSTRLRQEASLTLARNVDFMIVVGGKNSANTTRLAALISRENIPVKHIEGMNELKRNWFSGIKRVGITGGASTPKWLINKMKKKLEEISL